METVCAISVWRAERRRTNMFKPETRAPGDLREWAGAATIAIYVQD